MMPHKCWWQERKIIFMAFVVMDMISCVKCISYMPTPKYNVSEYINYKSFREQQLVRTLLDNNTYQNTLRPPGTGGITNSSAGDPVHVFASIEILSLSSFNDVTMTFTCQFRLQQEWVDIRLAFNDSYFRNDEFIVLARDQQVWQPDTFFQNEQSGSEHKIDTKNEFVRIRSDGRVRYNKRLTMAFSCPMNLLLFPHDTQTCEIQFASYAYTDQDISYVWDNTLPINMTEKAVAGMPKFAIEEYANGRYSCLKVILRLRREVSFFLLQLYLPSCMMVAVGCVSFWIDWRSAPARVPLAIVTLLTITTQAHGINSNLPPVSYTKAIDVWIGACVVFIFGALLEFAVVNYVGTNEEKRKAKWRECANGKDYCSIKMTNERRTKCSQRNGVSPADSGSIDHHRHLRHRRTRSRTKSEVPSSKQDHTHLLDEEARGDCFDAQEYVAYREKMRHRVRRPVVTTVVPMSNGENDCTSVNLLAASSDSTSNPNAPSNATRAERIDMVSRILFPIGFLCFNVVYWALYIPLMRPKSVNQTT